jgi:hypothetical protein
MTVVSWGKGDIPPEVSYWAGLVGIVGAVLLVLAYFALNAMQDRAYRKLHDKAHRPDSDSDADSTPDPTAPSMAGMRRRPGRTVTASATSER